MKKASYQELADYLGVTISTISKYPKKKRQLMLIGLYHLKIETSQQLLDSDPKYQRLLRIKAEMEDSHKETIP